MGPGPVLLQWGHGFSAVESPWNGGTLTLPKASFNGATAFQPWKAVSRVEGWEDSLPASMGPRLFSRGKPSYSIKTSSSTSGFNGATAFQPWKE